MDQDWTVVSRRKGAGKQGKAGIAPTAQTSGSLSISPKSPTSEGISASKSTEYATREASQAYASTARPSRRSLRRERTQEEKARDLQGHINLAKEEILKSDFFRELNRRMQQAEEDALEAAANTKSSAAAPATWDSIEKVIIYGLGSLEASSVPRYQLALALLLAEGFAAVSTPVEAYDPVFTELDKQVLHEAGCKVLEVDEQGARSVTSPTLFFLPHCTASFSHNVLAANWSPERLRNMAIIGNSLMTFSENWNSLSARQREGRTIPIAVLEVCRSRSVVDVGVKECDFPIRGAFNDLSVHLFPEFGVAGIEVQKLDLSHLKQAATGSQ